MSRILLMEDCGIQAMMLSDWLEIAGHSAAITHNIRDAIEQLRGTEKFDLVITDIFGPEGSQGEDGLTLIRHIRTQAIERLRTMPIISVSGVSLESACSGRTDWVRSDRHHVHMIKPLDLNELTSTIEAMTA